MDVHKYIYDAMYDDYLVEKEWEEVYTELSKEAIDTFTLERLQSYYLANPGLPAMPSHRSRLLLPLVLSSRSATTVFPIESQRP